MNVPTKTVIIIAGPTAVGKTAVAIDVARHFGTEIISADSRQCYRELNIGVARPSPAELAAVPHHFIASHSVHDRVTAAVFEAYALEKCREIFSGNEVVVMAGGTGLYIRAFLEGMDAIPEVQDAIREKLREQYLQGGMDWLRQQVREQDPAFYAQGEIQNPHRLLRALEVKQATGGSILQFRKGRKEARDFAVVQLGLELPREELTRRIDRRVDLMLQAGLEEEVRSLIPLQQLNALQTVGYRELFAFFNDAMSRAAAVERIRIHTRQYAKRQLTWFRNSMQLHWLPPDAGAVLQYLAGRV